MKDRLAKYTTFRLETDLSVLTPRERQMLPLLIDAAREMDDLFWLQAYGDKGDLLNRIKDPAGRRFAAINYGPWDRLDGDQPFLPEAGPKPPGARFYPPDITKEEFERAAARDPKLKELYTLVRRDDSGKLVAQPYHVAYASRLESAAAKLREAAALAEDPGLKRYLELRAGALITDRYQPSDFAWMEMKANTVDIVIGPIETYEDHLFGYKAAYEAYVLVKDKDWSRRLERYAVLLPGLQKQLPVPDAYKRETPGTDSDLNAYDVLYYSGDCNAGSKTIAINLPNDEQVQLKKGTRRLQLKNSMRAKFDRILTPIARELIAPEQQENIRFDAFFSNVMFHEVAHGLGVKDTLDGKGSVRHAMKDKASTIEEGKADILGLFIIKRLLGQGELTGTRLMDNYATFLAGIFRSVRFGASSAHGIANVVCFRFFERKGAFSRDAGGRYRVHAELMSKAVDALSERILRLQGDGDYDAASKFVAEHSAIPAQLQQDLARLASRQIPVDLVFEQGL
ncbi:MAG: dipeptidyl-peptidase 3 family protein [Bryobacteraceae bacterium]